MSTKWKAGDKFTIGGADFTYKCSYNDGEVLIGGSVGDKERLYNFPRVLFDAMNPVRVEEPITVVVTGYELVKMIEREEVAAGEKWQFEGCVAYFTGPGYGGYLRWNGPRSTISMVALTPAHLNGLWTKVTE